MRDEVQGWARIGSPSGVTLVARRANEKMRRVLSTLSAEPTTTTKPGEPPDPHREELEEELSDSALTAIVFTGVAVEAYIYDFGARHLGDAFVEKNLDKLSVQSKWAVIPRLAKGHIIEPGCQAFQSLALIVRNRNEVVHHKSEDITAMTPEALRARVEWGKTLHERAEDSISALDIVASEAEKFDPYVGLFSLGPRGAPSFYRSTG